MLDGIVMRVMDGVMAIPGILLAITLVALWRASLWTVILAITFTEIPRVVRLLRSLVLSIREEPYVEAAVAAGTPVLIDKDQAEITSGQVGNHFAGWLSFQPLYDRIVREQPDLLE